MALVTGHLGIFDADDLNGAAADSAVQTISIGANSATQAAAASRALLKKNRKNGHSALLFDGADDNYNFGDIFDLTTNNLIVFIVAKWSAGTLLAKTISGASNGRYSFTAYSGTKNFYGDLESGVVEALGADGAADSDFNLYELHINRVTGNVKIYRNGALFGSTAYPSNIAVNLNNAQSFRVGQYDASGALPLFGEIAYLVPYLRPTEFSAAELLQNRNELGARFALDYYASFGITTASPLPSGLVGVPYSATITTAGAAGAVSILPATSGLPAGLSLSVQGANIIVSGTPQVAGEYYDFILYLTDAATNTYKAFAVSVKTPPTSVWKKRQAVPFAALEAWNALDAATTGAEVADFAGKNRTLAATSNPPVLTPDVINGLPGIYFDGTKNPLKYSGNILFKHAFIVASFDGAAFANYEGLLSDLTTNPILLGSQGTDKFLNLSLSNYGEYIYSKNYVGFAEAGQLAPVANKIAIIEVKFSPSLFLNGIQIGQDRTILERKWKGYFIESLIYSEVKNDCERRQIYEYFAEKFHLWRQTSFGLNIFPFPNNRKTLGSSFVNELSSTSISGALKTRSKSGLIRRFDVPFGSRYQSEYEAAEAFWYQNRRRCVFEDCAVYPPRYYTGRITTPIDRDVQAVNHFDYKFGFETSGGAAPGGDGFNAVSGVDFLYEG